MIYDDFVHSHISYLRVEAAKQGHGLEKLVYDPDWIVRMAVAEQGYGLDKLIHDKNEIVIKYCIDNKEKPECREIAILYNL